MVLGTLYVKRKTRRQTLPSIRIKEMDGSPAPAALAVAAAAAEHAAGVADAALAGDGAQANDARAGRRQDAPLARRRVVRIGVGTFALEHREGRRAVRRAGTGSEPGQCRRHQPPSLHRSLASSALPSGSGSGRDRHDRAYAAGGFTASTSIGEPSSAAAGLVRRRGDASPGAMAVRRRAETRSYWG